MQFSIAKLNYQRVELFLMPMFNSYFDITKGQIEKHQVRRRKRPNAESAAAAPRSQGEFGARDGLIFLVENHNPYPLNHGFQGEGVKKVSYNYFGTPLGG